MAQAVVADRSGQEPSETNVLTGADCQKRGALCLVNQHWSRFSVSKLDQPVGARTYLIEEASDPCAVEVFDLVMCQ